MSIFDKTKPPTLPVPFQEFLVCVQQYGKKDSTIKMYKSDLTIIYEWLSKEKQIPENFGRICQIPTRALLDFIWTSNEEGRYAATTLKRMCYTIRHLLDYDGRESSDLWDAIQYFKGEISSELSINDVLDKQEFQRFIKGIRSSDGLSDVEKNYHSHIKERNVSIVTLMYRYGLSVQETSNISMDHLSFIQNTIRIQGDRQRTITLSQKDKLQLVAYHEGIPQILRPRLYSEHPLFLSLDTKRNTFLWVYETDSPKRLTPRAMQLMIQRETKRANLSRHVSAQILRNSFIVHAIEDGRTREELMSYLGVKNASLDRYIRFAKKTK